MTHLESHHLDPQLARVLRLDTRGAERLGEDLPANAVQLELYCWVPTPWVVKLQVQGANLQLKHAWDTQKMVDRLVGKTLEKSPHLHISWWLGSPLQPLS